METTLDRIAGVKLALVDAWLGSESGLDVIRRIQEHYPDIRVLLMSGNENREDWAEELGVSSLDKTTFAVAIGKLLKGRR